jgi:pimeloyl-ACP methyl ester carboxylesterase
MTGGARALLDAGRDQALAADLAACGAWTSGAESAAKIACPTVFVLGRHDVMTPARKGEELAKLVKGARSVTLPTAGHMMMQEAPDATLDALIQQFGAR